MLVETIDKAEISVTGSAASLKTTGPRAEKLEMWVCGPFLKGAESRATSGAISNVNIDTDAEDGIGIFKRHVDEKCICLLW